jgi:hypothetical protein
MPKYKTIVVDSASEWARLTFAKDMGKIAGNLDKIRAVNNYPGATERINMVVRRMKNFRDHGAEIVITAHEQLEKVYAKGGMIAAKGQTPQEPVAVKGWPDLPGTRCPDEVARACDNVFRVKRINRNPTWVAIPESVGGGGDNWEVKDRFNAPAIKNGYLPPSYEEIAKLAKANPACEWFPPYIWLIYGSFGIGKTRSLLTFPRPMYIFDIDRGCASLTENGKFPEGITVDPYDSEVALEYDRLISTLEGVAAA